MTAGGKPVDVFGMPSPNFADFDGDGDLDLLCGEFVDQFTYFQNVGTRTEPNYAAGRRLLYAGKPLTMDLCMIVPTAIDWDADGDVDLIVGEEDGRVALVEHTGRVIDGLPEFLPQRQFRQEAKDVKFGALVTPVSFDWDGDGLADILANSIWGKVVWFRNVGRRGEPKLAKAQPVQVEWPGRPPKPAWNWWTPQADELTTQWRTTPFATDLNRDGLTDLVMLDHEGYLALFRRAMREGELTLLPPERIFRGAGVCVFDSKGAVRQEGDGLLRLNDGAAGASGRYKLCLVDWDRDGKLDLLANSSSINFLRNVAEAKDEFVFHDEGPVCPTRLAGHTTSPTVVNWDRDGKSDLLIGAEDGYLYFVPSNR